jgi:hypothetical protein
MFYVRHVVASVALVAAGVACIAGDTAYAQVGDRSIGDPWWDEAVAPVQDAEAQNPVARRDGGMTILRRELSLVRATCPSLSRDARRSVVEAGLVGVEQGSRRVVDRIPVPVQQQVAPGVALRIQVNGEAKQSGAVQSVENAVAKKVAEVASADESKAYRRELAARAERRRSAAIAVIIDTVDQTAMLDEDQRNKLSAALEKKWQPFWDQAALQPGSTSARLPPGVSAVVAEVLSPEDFNRWQERLRRLPGS